jgi:hypothetical protein
MSGTIGYEELRAGTIRQVAQLMAAAAATLLKNLKVPARDAQLILGHSRLAVTLEIYTHEDRQAQRDALSRISDALRGDTGPETS